MTPPNIVLIICDQMRADFLGAYGCEAAHTPNIDWLAASGAKFSHAYSAVPSCVPARAILWTGQNQWHAGILGMGWGQGTMPNDYPHTLAGELTKASYQTRMVGKGHFHPHTAPMGFETTELDESGRMPDSDYRLWFKENAPTDVTPDDHGVNWNSWHARPWHTEERLHPTAWTMTRSLDFLKNRDRSRPFFLNVSFARPHSPYVPPKFYFDTHYHADLPEPSVGEWAATHDDPKTAADPNAWRGRMTPEAIRRARAGYLGEISFIDTQIGRLLNYIRYDADTARNTWFVFTSDHGDMQGDHNLWRKTYAYEGSSHIPFIVTPPIHSEFETRADVDEVVELRDVMPTLLSVAGVNVPNTVDGVNLLPVMKESDPNWRNYIHGEHCRCYSNMNDTQFVTNGRRKYIWLPTSGREQFFDLDADPGECLDLIHDPARSEEIDLWRGYLIKELKARDCGWVVDDRLRYPDPPEPLISPYQNVRRDE